MPGIELPGFEQGALEDKQRVHRASRWNVFQGIGMVRDDQHIQGPAEAGRLPPVTSRDWELGPGSA